MSNELHTVALFYTLKIDPFYRKTLISSAKNVQIACA